MLAHQPAMKSDTKKTFVEIGTESMEALRGKLLY